MAKILDAASLNSGLLACGKLKTKNYNKVKINSIIITEICKLKNTL
jgi:hypothetical protein